MAPIRWPNVRPIRNDELLRGRGAKGLRIAVLAEFGRNLVPKLPFLAAEGGPPRAPKSRGRLGYSSEKDIFERKFAHPIAKRTWMGEKMADIKGQNRGSADITSIQAFRGPVDDRGCPREKVDRGFLARVRSGLQSDPNCASKSLGCAAGILSMDISERLWRHVLVVGRDGGIQFQVHRRRARSWTGHRSA